MQKFDFANLDRFSDASLVTRMTTDVTVMLNAVNAGLRPLVRSPVMLCMGLAMACVLSPRLTIVFLVTTPILAAVLAWIVTKVGPLYGRQQSAVDHLNGRIQESLTAIRAIKAFHFNPRVTILLFFPPSYHRYFGTYPYNFLRNLCLRHTTTSHFLFLDTDMIPSRVAPPPHSPSGNLFDAIIHLPPEILDSPKAAVIIPPFFFPQRMSRVCGTLSACLNKFACSPLSTVGVWRWRRAPWRSSIAASSRVSATRRRGFSPRTSEF